MNHANDLRNLLLRKDASSSASQTIFSALGLNAVNLEQQAKSLVPYNAPFLNSTPRVTSDVGGLSVQWKAILSASPGFVTLPEASRNQSADLLEKDYQTTFKSMGVDVDVSMFAQETGRGFQDNLGFAQFSALQMYLRAQDQQLLCDGNSGTAGNGYALATASTPVVSAVTGGTITESDLSVRVVALTPFGLRAQQDPFLNPNINATAKGLTPLLSATSMNGDAITASGGTSIISAASNVIAPSSQAVKIVVPAQLGAVAYAVYVNITDASSPAKPNTFFQGISNGNVIVLKALAAGVTGGTSQAATFTGLTTDYSFDVNAIDSYFAWTVNWANPPAGYSAFPSSATDLAGATLTALGDGSIGEFNTIASFLYDNYKSAPDRILCASKTVSGTSLKSEVQAAILGTGTDAASRLIFDSKDGVITAGTKQVAYEWPYSYDGISKVITIETMPWLQPGMVIFQTTQNPYPQAAGAIPSAFEVHSLLDTFSVVWPIRKLQRELGVYGFLASKNYLPHVSAFLQNVG
jgi:hypothetical protein